MDIQLESSPMLPDGLTREQVGWLAELDLDRAILLGSHGRLHPFIPLFDTHRVDRLYVWDGTGRAVFIQAKATGHARNDGRYSWMVPASHFQPYEGFDVALTVIDRASGGLRELLWLVPSLKLASLAAHGYNAAAGGPVYELTASATGYDALSVYRTSLGNLGRKLALPAELQLPLPERLPSLHQEQGAFYEFSHVAEQLRESKGDVLLFRPASDIAGRDLAVQLVDSPKLLFIQIKGTARLAERDSIHITVRRRSFLPRQNFWLVFYYYDRQRDAFFEQCWMVPSLEFADRTRDQRDATTITFEAHLSAERDRWRDFRHPFTAQGAVVRQALHRLPAQAVTVL